MLPPALWPYLCNLSTTPAAATANGGAAANTPSEVVSTTGRPSMGFGAPTTCVASNRADISAETVPTNATRPLMGFHTATPGAAAASTDSTPLIPATPSVPFAIPLPSNLKLAQDPVNGKIVVRSFDLLCFQGCGAIFAS